MCQVLELRSYRQFCAFKRHDHELVLVTVALFFSGKEEHSMLNFRIKLELV